MRTAWSLVAVIVFGCWSSEVSAQLPWQPLTVPYASPADWQAQQPPASSPMVYPATAPTAPPSTSPDWNVASSQTDARPPARSQVYVSDAFQSPSQQALAVAPGYAAPPREDVAWLAAKQPVAQASPEPTAPAPNASVVSGPSLVDGMLAESPVYDAPPRSSIPWVRYPSDAPPGMPPAMIGGGIIGGSTHAPLDVIHLPSDYVWYFDAVGLVFNRLKPDGITTSFATGAPATSLMNTAQTDLSWSGGWQLSAGRTFGEHWALEGSYWAISCPTERMSLAPAGTLDSPLLLENLEFGTDGVDTFFDGAQEHRLSRANQFQSFELNLVREVSRQSLQNPWTVAWLLGFHYFRFEESVLFSSLQTDANWGEDGGIYEAYLYDRVLNELSGLQFGGKIQYDLGRRFGLFLNPKLGIYSNQIQHQFTVYQGDGTLATPTVASGQTGTFPVESQRSRTSLIGQLDLGFDWQARPNWDVYVGYRVLFATGIALADDQIPSDPSAFAEIAAINASGDLVLHGLILGTQYRF